MGGVWSFLTKIEEEEVVEAVAVVAVLRTPSAMSAANLDILLGSVAEEAMGAGVEALAPLAVAGVQIMVILEGESLTKTFLLSCLNQIYII